MEIEIRFPGGKRVDALVGGHWISTDQPVDHGGQGSAAGPFELFLASVATCAGFYVLAFCEARKLSMAGLKMRQIVELDDKTKLPLRIQIALELPTTFPAAYRAAVVRAAEGCKVKRTLASQPSIEVIATAAEPAEAAAVRAAS